ncbi:hypothetical protein HYX17_03610 [Candidatus Woesearchaeota archaeon]|nr:hypothetical protein [Candidatus Woesearchaeota archaeon]
MGKKSIFIFLIFGILIIAGCDSSTNNVSTNKAFIGGEKGLLLSFSEDTPDRIGDNNADKFDIVINVENNGEQNIERGKIIASLQGIDRDAFSLNSLSAKSNTDLAGKKKFRDREESGEELELEFKDARYKFDLDADFNVNIRADVCYEYKTRTQSDICLKREANKRLTNDVCKLDNENVNLENSGSPLKVSKLSQRPSGANEVSFTFDIEKTGKGDVYEPGAFFDVCDEKREKKDKIKVKVTSVSGNINPSCNRLGGGNEGIIDLISGKRTITCEISTSGLQDFAHTRPLRIELSYFFKESVEKKIIVEDTEA